MLIGRLYHRGVGPSLQAVHDPSLLDALCDIQIDSSHLAVFVQRGQTFVLMFAGIFKSSIQVLGHESLQLRMQTGGVVAAVWICCRDVVTSLGLVITS